MQDGIGSSRQNYYCYQSRQDRSGTSKKSTQCCCPHFFRVCKLESSTPIHGPNSVSCLLTHHLIERRASKSTSRARDPRRSTLGTSALFRLLHLVKQIVQPLEAGFPNFTITFEPFGGFGQGLRFEPSRPTLCVDTR